MKISNPSKFGPGCGLLWNGNTLKNLSLFKKHNNLSSTQFIYFNSARSIIYSFLNSLKLTSNDEILISAFTCNAVTDSISFLKCKMIPIDINIDLSMSFNDILNKVTKNTKVIIVQNSFGRLGLKTEEFLKIRDMGIIIIEDCCLSYGSKIDNINHGSFGDISFHSFEVSKTVTIGWGGCLKINSKKYHINLKEQQRISIFTDLRRYFELSVALYLNEKKFRYGTFLWYFLYGTRLLSKSKTSLYFLKDKPGLGLIGKILINNIDLNYIYTKTNNNFNYLYSSLKSIKSIYLPIGGNKSEFIVSPRFPIFFPEDKREILFEEFKKNNLSIGTWFDEIPSCFESQDSLLNTKSIVKSISNIPIHYTISKDILNLYVSIIKKYCV